MSLRIRDWPVPPFLPHYLLPSHLLSFILPSLSPSFLPSLPSLLPSPLSSLNPFLIPILLAFLSSLSIFADSHLIWLMDATLDLMHGPDGWRLDPWAWHACQAALLPPAHVHIYSRLCFPLYWAPHENSYGVKSPWSTAMDKHFWLNRWSKAHYFTSLKVKYIFLMYKKEIITPLIP